MKKLGFVVPWYGDKIPGGAETELRGIAKHLNAAGVELEILTTCVKEFSSDWNENFHKPGLSEEGGLKVRRFKVRKRDTAVFDAVNYKFITGAPVSESEEADFMAEMVNSSDLYDYMEEHKDEYSLYVYIPYMFGTTYNGVLRVPEKSVLIPCLHEEAYAHMKLFSEMFSKAKGSIYLAQSEYELANRLYPMENVKQAVLGAGVDSDFEGNAQRFREKTGIEDPFILYAGRKDEGKNIYLLIDYFREYRLRNKESNLKLVLIGGGDVRIPDDIKSEIIDLGFVERELKFDAYAAALCLCQPSVHESFSIVIMESWLCQRPVLVHAGCDVTKSFAITSNSGLYFENYYEFEGCINYYLKNEDVAAAMGKTGREFVMSNFTWDIIVDRYTKFFESLSET
ncbi:MAG: glycosyltransferase family 4 protein [Saccharofermentans sp.]|nr:glycosyltransferase family 4 protein [Saccharofermentans sp.]